MIKQHNRHATAGFTLTELAIVLGVIGLILGGVWAAVNSVMSSSRNNQAVQDISTMAYNMRSTFTAAPKFTVGGDQTQAMIAAGIIPQALVNRVTGNTAINAWGGSIRIFLSTPDTTHFRILYSSTSSGTCFAIASQLANLGTSDAPVGLVTGAAQTVTAISVAAGALGLSTNAVTAACANNSVAGAAADLTGFDYTIH